MAQAKKHNGIFAAAAGAMMSAAAVLAPVAASAEDSLNVREPQNTAITQEWNAELLELHRAALAAREYAENNNGVGILIHVGLDIPNEHFASADQFGETMVRLFNERYGTEAQYFLSQNDARATGIEYRIADLIHGADNGTEIKDVKEAIAAMPEVVGMLRILNTDKVASLDSDLTPEPGN